MADLASGIYEIIEMLLGKRKADEVADDVRNGNMTEEEATAFGEKLRINYEQSKGRRSIEPEEWQDFEEGWRPDNW